MLAKPGMTILPVLLVVTRHSTLYNGIRHLLSARAHRRKVRFGVLRASHREKDLGRQHLEALRQQQRRLPVRGVVKHFFIHQRQRRHRQHQQAVCSDRVLGGVHQHQLVPLRIVAAQQHHQLEACTRELGENTIPKCLDDIAAELV